MFWNEWKINFPIFSFWALSQLKIRRLPPPLKSCLTSITSWKIWNVLNRMGKIMKKFSDFYFLSSAKFHRKLGWWHHKNNQKITITRKIKIGKFLNLIFLSIQLISDLVLSWEKDRWSLNQHPHQWHRFDVCYWNVLKCMR